MGLPADIYSQRTVVNAMEEYQRARRCVHSAKSRMKDRHDGKGISTHINERGGLVWFIGVCIQVRKKSETIVWAEEKLSFEDRNSARHSEGRPHKPHLSAGYCSYNHVSANCRRGCSLLRAHSWRGLLSTGSQRFAPGPSCAACPCTLQRYIYRCRTYLSVYQLYAVARGDYCRQALTMV